MKILALSTQHFRFSPNMTWLKLYPLKCQARHVIFAYWFPANPEAMSFYFKIYLVNQYRNNKYHLIL